jgi:hypothetical protein
MTRSVAPAVTVRSSSDMSRRSLRQLEPPPDAARRSEADGGENLRLRRAAAGAGAGSGSDATAGMAASIGAVARLPCDLADEGGLIFFFVSFTINKIFIYILLLSTIIYF